MINFLGSAALLLQDVGLPSSSLCLSSCLYGPGKMMVIEYKYKYKYKYKDGPGEMMEIE